MRRRGTLGVMNRPNVQPLFVIALAGVCLGLFGPGCAGPKLMPNPQPVAADAYGDTFELARQVLRDEGYRVNRADYRFGQITTHPKGSPTLLEPWHDDNRAADVAWDSTLGQLRRTARVTLEPDAALTPKADEQSSQAAGSAALNSPGVTASGTMYLVRVEVQLERYQAPQRRMNGSTAGTVFADLSETPAELQDRGITGAYWQPLGRDIPLEQHLLRKITATPNADRVAHPK